MKHRVSCLERDIEHDYFLSILELACPLSRYLDREILAEAMGMHKNV